MYQKSMNECLLFMEDIPKNLWKSVFCYMPKNILFMVQYVLQKTFVMIKLCYDVNVDDVEVDFYDGNTMKLHDYVNVEDAEVECYDGTTMKLCLCFLLQ